jgi:hypothetical protein
MEVAGVVIGALALVGVFEDCVTLFSQFGAAKTFETDYVLLATRLDLQKALLLQWAERMRIYDEELCDPRLDDPNIGSVIYKTLDCIRKLLQDGSALQDLYGVRLARMEERTESSGAASSGLMSRLRHNPLALRLRRAVVGVPIDQSRSLHESSGGHCSAKRPRPDIGPSPPHQEAIISDFDAAPLLLSLMVSISCQSTTAKADLLTSTKLNGSSETNRISKASFEKCRK